MESVVSFTLTTKSSVITKQSDANKNLGDLVSKLKVLKSEVNGIITDIINTTGSDVSVKEESEDGEESEDENTNNANGDHNNQETMTAKRCVHRQFDKPKKRIKT